MSLFEVKDIDRKIYEGQIADFLPDEIIDSHAHIWLDSFRLEEEEKQRATAWSRLIAAENPAEELVQTYRLLYPGKKVTPVVFGNPKTYYDIDKSNDYVTRCGRSHGWPTLLLTYPEWSAEEVERRIKLGGHVGSKVYLNFSPRYIPAREIRIYDFLPRHQLKKLDELGLACVLHISREQRLRDPVNLAQLLEIERDFPNVKLIVAHIGRAYADSDVGDAFETLKDTRNMVFDISANVNANVMEMLINAVGPRRVLFGTDLPVARMRMRRDVEGGRYMNVIPRGLYGDVSGEPNMRECDPPEADALTFMAYEQILALKKACGRAGLVRRDVEDIFYGNSARIFGISKEVRT